MKNKWKVTVRVPNENKTIEEKELLRFSLEFNTLYELSKYIENNIENGNIRPHYPILITRIEENSVHQD